MVERKSLKKILPEPVKPVIGRGKIGPKGYIPENSKWWLFLTRDVKGRRVGVDPREIPTYILEGAGHPQRTATRCLRVYLRDLELPRTSAHKGLKAVKRTCLECAENRADVRDCTYIDCPLWLHRMGQNPYNLEKRRLK